MRHTLLTLLALLAAGGPHAAAATSQETPHPAFVLRC